MHRHPELPDMKESSAAKKLGNMLLDCDLFSSFDRLEIESIAPHFNLLEIEKGDAVFREGDPGTFMCIVISGKVSILKNRYDGTVVEIATLHGGRPFGEMAVLDGERRSATCIAATQCTLLALSKDALDSMILHTPAIAARVVRVVAVSLSKRLRLADGQLVDRRSGNSY
ncbi:MAG: cyclic nucleotide-binding domain-containing protein [Burkholderiales bacterium]